MPMTKATPSTLLITHTDRDGILSGAALLRALETTTEPQSQPHVLLTQGSFLAFELEDLMESGRIYNNIFVCDTYWHPAHADRLSAGFRTLLAPGGTLTWIDHHPSSVEGEAQMRDLLPGLRTLIRGDHEGIHEAVSLVIRLFDLDGDPLADGLLAAAQLRWTRRGELIPPPVQAWLNVIDGLSRTPDLPADEATQIVRFLAKGFEIPVPPGLQPQGRHIEACRARSRELAQQPWSHLPSVAGGWGILLDLREEPLAIAYELQWALFQNAERRVDYFVVQESTANVHYVSGPRARLERDRLERTGHPDLRVGTFHKGTKGERRTRFQRGVDLTYMTRRRPAAALLGTWIDAHPYLVKAPWTMDCLNDQALHKTAEGIGKAMVGMLQTYGWTDEDRRWKGGYRRTALTA